METCRKAVIDLFNTDKDKTLDYIPTAILRDTPDVPTKVIKAVKDGFEEITSNDELGVFLPMVKFVRAYPSTTSKQNFDISLTCNLRVTKLNFSIRSNKVGVQHKLGQFLNLAVKFNGAK